MSLLDGLVSWWDFDEAGGMRYDSFGKNHLTDVNTVTSNSGKVNLAARFDVANQEYLEILDADQAGLKPGNSDFSIAAWVYFYSLTSYRFIMSKSRNPSDYEYALDYNGSQFRFYCNNTDFGIALGLSPVVSTWYFVVGWHDSVNNTVNLQINNGTPVSVSFAQGCKLTTAPVRIGAYASSATTFFMDGLIDSIGYWSRVLGSSERTELYNSGGGLGFGDLFKAGAVWL